MITEYTAAGFDHIIPQGLDHILFVLGLFLFSTRMRPLLWQVTMFTIAHSITLAMAMTGMIELPARIVEPLIALSIAYVGIENIWHRRLHKSRLVLVFAFGLLHGLGFASMLADFGMPDDAFVTALITFNVGVELGQLAVILVAFLAIGLWFGGKPYYRRLVVIPGSLMITLVGLYWTWERLSLNEEIRRSGRSGRLQQIVHQHRRRDAETLGIVHADLADQSEYLVVCHVFGDGLLAEEMADLVDRFDHRIVLAVGAILRTNTPSIFSQSTGSSFR